MVQSMIQEKYSDEDAIAGYVGVYTFRSDHNGLFVPSKAVSSEARGALAYIVAHSLLRLRAFSPEGHISYQQMHHEKLKVRTP
jgi:hypothetical protein